MAKKFGDRKDGAKLRNIHAMHLVMPLMYQTDVTMRRSSASGST